MPTGGSHLRASLLLAAAPHRSHLHYQASAGYILVCCPRSLLCSLTLESSSWCTRRSSNSIQTQAEQPKLQSLKPAQRRESFAPPFRGGVQGDSSRFPRVAGGATRSQLG